MYHRDPNHTGRGSDLPVLGAIGQKWSAQVDGVVYAEPLSAANQLFIVTENDTAYDFTADVGTALWKQHLGEPVPRSMLPCGNIDPSGATSTPVIDTKAGVLYMVARVAPTHHELFALDTSTGAVKFHRTVDPPGADARYLQQRSALALANGRVYIAFGGNFGDCGPYKGWVVASQADGQGALLSWAVPTQREGALWAPAGPVIDSNGDLLVATGNAASTTAFDYGNAVIRLSPDLQLKDYWAPGDWAALSRSDQDIGSISPTLVDLGQLFQSGKNGQGYLLKADHLGNIGGQLATKSICAAAFGANAYQSPMVYVPCTDWLVAVKVGPGTLDVAWSAPLTSRNAPIIAYGSVWVVDSGAPALVRLDPATGEERSKTPLPGPAVAHFITPTAAGQKIFVTSGPNVLAFG